MSELIITALSNIELEFLERATLYKGFQRYPSKTNTGKPSFYRCNYKIQSREDIDCSYANFGQGDMNIIKAVRVRTRTNDHLVPIDLFLAEKDNNYKLYTVVYGVSNPNLEDPAIYIANRNIKLFEMNDEEIMDKAFIPNALNSVDLSPELGNWDGHLTLNFLNEMEYICRTGGTINYLTNKTGRIFAFQKNNIPSNLSSIEIKDQKGAPIKFDLPTVERLENKLDENGLDYQAITDYQNYIDYAWNMSRFRTFSTFNASSYSTGTGEVIRECLATLVKTPDKNIYLVTHDNELYLMTPNAIALAIEYGTCQFGGLSPGSHGAFLELKKLSTPVENENIIKLVQEYNNTFDISNFLNELGKSERILEPINKNVIKNLEEINNLERNNMAFRCPYAIAVKKYQPLIGSKNVVRIAVCNGNTIKNANLDEIVEQENFSSIVGKIHNSEAKLKNEVRNISILKRILGSERVPNILYYQTIEQEKVLDLFRTMLESFNDYIVKKDNDFEGRIVNGQFVAEQVLPNAITIKRASQDEPYDIEGILNRKSKSEINEILKEIERYKSSACKEPKPDVSKMIDMDYVCERAHRFRPKNGGWKLDISKEKEFFEYVGTNTHFSREWIYSLFVNPTMIKNRIYTGAEVLNMIKENNKKNTRYKDITEEEFYRVTLFNPGNYILEEEIVGTSLEELVLNNDDHLMDAIKQSAELLKKIHLTDIESLPEILGKGMNFIDVMKSRIQNELAQKLRFSPEKVELLKSTFDGVNKSGYPPTLILGDPHWANMILRETDNKVVIIDPEMLSIGTPEMDIGRVFGYLNLLKVNSLEEAFDIKKMFLKAYNESLVNESRTKFGKKINLNMELVELYSLMDPLLKAVTPNANFKQEISNRALFLWMILTSGESPTSQE